jgi:hypothetical protein
MFKLKQVISLSNQILRNQINISKNVLYTVEKDYKIYVGRVIAVHNETVSKYNFTGLLILNNDQTKVCTHSDDRDTKVL